MDIKTQVGINARKARLLRGLSQDEASFNAGLDRTYVGNLERGKVNATIESLSGLAAALGVPVKDFFEDLPDDAELPSPLRGGRKAGSRR
ncbi:helix-turn-helix domain-containing protein [Aquamicrobium lusatiense]|uniref:helix-turn-helix domain-containing protein n=1 Tax=Aquamicrobium lusatiense TaxID=89772 RepID=UPI003CC7D6A8